MNEELLNKLQKILNVNFNSPQLLFQALTHRSFPNEHPQEHYMNNERLEFLGDAILEFLTSEFLYGKFVDDQEGLLTSYRAALVKTENLAIVAKKLNLQDYIYMSKGEFALGNSSNISILADTFEAILGAIYIDQGLQKCKEILQTLVWCEIDEIVRSNLHIDPKTKLQIESQLSLKITPTYEIISENGKDHEKTFQAVVKIKSKVIGQGSGLSKQAAEQNAASDALANLVKDPFVKN